MTQSKRSRLFLALSLTPLLGACTGPGSFFKESNNSLSIQSNPTGAQVWIMGQQRGATPTRVPVSDVFPQVYPPENQGLYGQVRLVKAGCDQLTVPVSTTAVASGIDATLACASSPASAVPAPAGRSKPPAAVPRHSVSAKSRLIELRELRRDNLITEKEYQQLRQRVLDTL